MALIKDLGTYLWHKVAHQGRNKKLHDRLLQRLKDYLEGWKSRCLTRAGRVTLAKSVLSSVLVFNMQLGKLPSRVHKEIDRFERRCVWGNLGSEWHIHLLNWEMLCWPKDKGSLGLRKADSMNKSFLAKLTWRMVTEDVVVWCEVLKGKCGLSSGEGLKFSEKQWDSRIWKGVWWDYDLIRKGAKWSLRDGKSIYFWLDRWLEKNPLLQVARQPVDEEFFRAKVASYWADGRVWRWDMFLDWLPLASQVKLARCTVELNKGGPDEISWLKLGSRKFEVSSTDALEENWSQDALLRGWSLIWKLRVQQRIKDFLWLVSHDRLLTNFARWHWGMSVTNECSRCNNVKEDTMHVIRDCKYALEGLA